MKNCAKTLQVDAIIVRKWLVFLDQIFHFCYQFLRNGLFRILYD